MKMCQRCFAYPADVTHACLPATSTTVPLEESNPLLPEAQIDEREKFEAWAQREQIDICRTTLPQFKGRYDSPRTEWAWAGWQARAASPLLPAGGQVRTLTEAEIVRLCEHLESISSPAIWELIQRKFCEVNSLKIAAAPTGGK